MLIVIVTVSFSFLKVSSFDLLTTRVFIKYQYIVSSFFYNVSIIKEK
jgi:hypothetical protein